MGAAADMGRMRLIRRNIPSVVYHVIWRFVDQRWFLTNDEQRAVYLRLLGRALHKSDWRCFGFALMSNHIHLALLAGAMRLSAWSVRVSSPFALWINEQHRRIGPVFVRGPADHMIRPAKEAALLAYIHRNPVRAGVVANAVDSTWTSHRAYLGLTPRPDWLHVDEALFRIGMTSATFASWTDGELGESGIVDARETAKLARRRGGLRIATASTAELPIVARPFAHVRIDPRRLVQIAAEVSNVGWMLVCSRRRLAHALTVRRAFVHAGRTFGLSDTDLADTLGLSQQGVSKMATRTLSPEEREIAGLICERARFEVSSESRG
jgi:hypothetical protein